MIKNVSKILVPTDLSEFSRGALEYASALASQYDAELVFLHVVTEKEAELVANSHVPRATIDEVFLELKQRVYQEILQEHPEILVENLRIGIEIVMGDLADGVVEAAERVDADLIVMGTHGRTGLSHLLMGSVAENVVRSAPCPVLTVKAGEAVPKAA